VSGTDETRRASAGQPLSIEERAAHGKAARLVVPRATHGEWAPAADRADPIALLEGQATTRVPELVPIRYGRMLASAFAFYRGAAAIMASDLAATPRSGFDVQCCGDAHLSNFGVFGSPERRLVFDVNDFDETLPGPWEWDVKRLVASMVVAARERGFAAADAERIVLGTAAEYRTQMATFAAARTIDVWYARVDIDTVRDELAAQVDRTTRKTTDKLLAKARTRDSMDALNKLTRMVDGQPRIISKPPLIVPLDELGEGVRKQTVAELKSILRTYHASLADDRRVLLDAYELTDFARKVVGVGSVGTQAWIALLLGRDASDPLFLQVKEAQASVLEGFSGRSEYTNSGQRVVAGQRLMQAASDIFLGWQRITGLDGVTRDFYLRQLRDWKGSALVEGMPPKTMKLYARMCGWTLARSHARSGDRIAIAAYLGNSTVFDEAIADFSTACADQNESDHAVLRDAVTDGRITAQPGL